jgi:hypothetical protein
LSAEIYEKLLLDLNARHEQAAFLRASKKNAKACPLEDE